jgi:hypothetical protein
VHAFITSSINPTDLSRFFIFTHLAETDPRIDIFMLKLVYRCTENVHRSGKFQSLKLMRGIWENTNFQNAITCAPNVQTPWNSRCTLTWAWRFQLRTPFLAKICRGWDQILMTSTRRILEAKTLQPLNIYCDTYTKYTTSNN